jgi:hypothetical protein
MIKDCNNKDGNFLESIWYDVNRLNILTNKRVMDCPHFKNKYEFTNIV